MKMMQIAEVCDCITNIGVEIAAQHATVFARISRKQDISNRNKTTAYMQTGDKVAHSATQVYMLS